MDTIESSTKCDEYRDNVALDFGLLTLEAGASPLPRVSLDAWPDIASSQEVLGSPDARMRKVMQRFDMSQGVCTFWQWYHTSSGTNRSIQQQETEVPEKVNDDEGLRDGVKNECADEQSMITPAP